jgi:hypothetical protein
MALTRHPASQPNRQIGPVCGWLTAASVTAHAPSGGALLWGVAIIAVLFAVLVAVVALGSVFSSQLDSRQAARRTLDLLLRLAPWYRRR